MTPPESETDAPEPLELTEREAANLRAAGRWARLAGGVGNVALCLMTLVLIDVGVNNPRGLFDLMYGDSVPLFAERVASAIGYVGAIALVWVFGRNVAAFFARDDVALTRAFRRIRQFFILWTWVVALTSVLALLAALAMRPFAGL